VTSEAMMFQKNLPIILVSVRWIPRCPATESS